MANRAHPAAVVVDGLVVVVVERRGWEDGTPQGGSIPWNSSTSSLVRDVQVVA